MIICTKLFQIPPCMTIIWFCKKCKIRLWPWPLTKQHDSCLQYIILSWWSFVSYFLKSHHAWQSYWLDTKRFHWNLCTNWRVGCDLDFYLATRFLFATHPLIMITICAKLLSNPTMHNKVMGRTWAGFTGLCIKFKCGLWPLPLT